VVLVEHRRTGRTCGGCRDTAARAAILRTLIKLVRTSSVDISAGRNLPLAVSPHMSREGFLHWTCDETNTTCDEPKILHSNIFGRSLTVGSVVRSPIKTADLADSSRPAAHLAQPLCPRSETAANKHAGHRLARSADPLR